MDKTSRFSPLRTLLTGAVALLPLVATALVLWWLWRVVMEYLGPQSWFGRTLSRITDGLTDSEWAQYALGLVGLVLIVYVVGVVVEIGVRRGWRRLVDAIVARIPVVRTIYDVVQKLVSSAIHEPRVAALWRASGSLYQGARAAGLAQIGGGGRGGVFGGVGPHRACARGRGLALCTQRMGGGGRCGHRRAHEHLRVDGRDDRRIREVSADLTTECTSRFGLQISLRAEPVEALQAFDRAFPGLVEEPRENGSSNPIKRLIQRPAGVLRRVFGGVCGLAGDGLQGCLHRLRLLKA
jgi:hypothetical protein